MIRALVSKFNPLDEGAVQALMLLIQSLELLDTEDLCVYHDKLENLHLQLSWVGQGMSESHIVYLAQTHLKKSRYKKDIDALQISNTASGVTFGLLHELCTGLECLEHHRGLPYGGAATTKSQPSPLCQPNSILKTQKTLGFVAAVKDSQSSPFEKHAEAWIGASNLSESQAKQLQSLFKCPTCHTNSHTFPSCPLLKN